MKELQRLSAKLFYNRPLLLSEDDACFYNEYLQSRNYNEPFASALNLKEKSIPFGATFNEQTKIGFISVSGTLTNKPSFNLCDGETASYQKLQYFTDELISKGAKQIVLEADSGGGEAYRMMETSKYMRDKADENDVKLIAYVDGRACSAMYGLISSFHEVIVNPDASVGSIGVLIALTNNLKGKIEKGEVQFVTSGKGKIPFAENGDFRKDFIDDLQANTDELYEKFTGHVASYRNISVEKLKEIGANTFRAEKALSLNLIDSIKTYDEYQNYISSMISNPKQTGKTNMSVLDNAVKLQELEGKLQATESIVANLKEQLESEKDSVAKLTSSVEKLKEENSSLSTKLSDAEKEKEQAKVSARKEKLLAIVGESKLEETFALASDMSDEKFESFSTLLSKTNKEVPMGKEVGEEGQTVASEENPNEISLKEFIV